VFLASDFESDFDPRAEQKKAVYVPPLNRAAVSIPSSDLLERAHKGTSSN
jgi:hypothetical protein